MKIVSVQLGSKCAFRFVFVFFFLGFCLSPCQLPITNPESDNENLAGEFASRHGARALSRTTRARGARSPPGRHEDGEVQHVTDHTLCILFIPRCTILPI